MAPNTQPSRSADRKTGGKPVILGGTTPPLTLLGALIQDAPVTSLRDTIRQLKAQRDVLKMRWQELETAIAALEKVDDTSNRPDVDKSSVKPGPYSSLTNPDAVRKVLDAHGPLTVPDILKELAKGGRVILTASPYRTIYKVLRDRPETFTNDNGQWRVRGTK